MSKARRRSPGPTPRAAAPPQEPQPRGGRYRIKCAFDAVRAASNAQSMRLGPPPQVMSYEERTLRRRFGPAYQEYRRTVPRWLARPPAPTQAR